MDIRIVSGCEVAAYEEVIKVKNLKERVIEWLREEILECNPYANKYMVLKYRMHEPQIKQMLRWMERFGLTVEDIVGE